jgi:hypothetical protein
MPLFKGRSSLLEVQNKALIKTARERAARIDELERELQSSASQSLRREVLFEQCANETSSWDSVLWRCARRLRPGRGGKAVIIGVHFSHQAHLSPTKERRGDGPLTGYGVAVS